MRTRTPWSPCMPVQGVRVRSPPMPAHPPLSRSLARRPAFWRASFLSRLIVEDPAKPVFALGTRPTTRASDHAPEGPDRRPVNWAWRDRGAVAETDRGEVRHLPVVEGHVCANDVRRFGERRELHLNSRYATARSQSERVGPRDPARRQRVARCDRGPAVRNCVAVTHPVECVLTPRDDRRRPGSRYPNVLKPRERHERGAIVEHNAREELRIGRIGGPLKEPGRKGYG